MPTFVTAFKMLFLNIELNTLTFFKNLVIHILVDYDQNNFLEILQQVSNVFYSIQQLAWNWKDISTHFASQ